jgi:hypothetical protein
MLGDYLLHVEINSCLIDVLPARVNTQKSLSQKNDRSQKVPIGES